LFITNYIKKLMVLETKKPVTPSQRHLVKLSRKKLRKEPMLKKFIKGMKNSSGRNNSGKITVRHKGGGHKKNYRTLDFFRNTPSTAITCSIEYDPNRKANIAAIFDIFLQKFSYILAPKNIKIGDIIKSGPNAETKNGHSLPISKVPVGSYIYNVMPAPKKPAQIARSAGTFSQITEKTLEYAKIKLSSGEQRLVSVKSYATIGTVSNEFAFLEKLGKAGQSRWLNKRPSVRGVAMNPIDHPHGGGEGKKSGICRTPWGKPTKGRKTSRSKNRLILKN
jgi:large subunit ribosomal protein L2